MNSRWAPRVTLFSTCEVLRFRMQPCVLFLIYDPCFHNYGQQGVVELRYLRLTMFWGFECNSVLFFDLQCLCHSYECCAWTNLWLWHEDTQSTMSQGSDLHSCGSLSWGLRMKAAADKVCLLRMTYRFRLWRVHLNVTRKPRIPV